MAKTDNVPSVFTTPMIGSAALRRALLGSAAGIALSGGLSPALAQNYPAAPPSGGGAVQLPTVSVEGAGTSTNDYKADRPTLPKLTEPLLNTPQTIDVVTRQVLDDQGVTNFRDALRNVPGIGLAAGEGGSQGDNVTIRGFSARGDIYLDGMRDFGSYYRDPFFMDSLQVLKGPSSILFGKGSTGGVVEQDSKTPKLDNFYGGTLSFGTDNTKRLTADVNQVLPQLGEGAAIRLNVMGHNSQLADRDVGENSRFGLAPSLALGLGTPTRILFTYLHQSEYDTPDYGLPWLYTSTTPAKQQQVANPTPLSLTQSNYYGFENGNFLRTNADVATAKIEHDFDKDTTLTNQFRYAHYTREFSITEPQLYTTASATTPGGTGVALLVPPNVPLSSLMVSRNQLIGHSLETYVVDQLDLTKRFWTGPLDHTMRAGIELGRETSDPVRSSTLAPYSQTPLLDPNPSVPDNAQFYTSSRTYTTADTQAVYALDTIKFGEQWQLMGGLRLDRFHADFAQFTYANPVTGAGAGQSAFSRTDTFLSWRAALVYKPMPIGSVYFSAGTSSNPSAEQLSLSLANSALPPEKTQSYEIGTKWDLLDGRMAVSSALFRTEKTDMSEPDPTNPLFNILAGSGLAEGGEIQVSGHITEPWQVIAGYAYTYSVITSSPRTGATSDLGHRLANTPAHSASLWTEYQTPWKVELGAGFNFVGSRYAATTPTTAGGIAFFKEVPSYWTIGLMAKYPLTDHVSAQVNIYNLTDNKYYDQLHPAHVVPGPGRTALFTLNVKY